MKMNIGGDRAARIPVIIVLCCLAVGMGFAVRKFVRATFSSPSAENRTGPVARISVGRTGKIMVDGKETTLAQLEPVLARLRATDGTVYYYREDGQDNPSPMVMRVVTLVLNRGVAMSLSSKADFSDYVDTKGASHPRK